VGLLIGLMALQTIACDLAVIEVGFADKADGEQVPQFSLQIPRQTSSEPLLSDHAPLVQPFRSCSQSTPALAIHRNTTI